MALSTLDGLQKRRGFIKAAAAGGLATAAGLAGAQTLGGSRSANMVEFKPSTRYPDVSVEILDPGFAKYRLYSSSVEQLGSGMRWAEGPVYFPAARYLVVSDIPNNRMMRYDEVTGAWGVFREPSNQSNGNTRDLQGRLVTCEHLTRRVTRTEHNGKITVLADSYQGKRLNSPNDIVCKSDGSLWFTDPPFGIGGNWEGDKATSELPQAVYRISPDGRLQAIITDLAGPNGLAFSPDESKLYVIESRATPSRIMWSYDVGPDGVTLGNKTKVFDANGAGALDGFKIDKDGNFWCGWGSDGRAGVNSADLDGVKVFNAKGKPIGFIHLPERCPNLTFGGPKNNRLYMASSHSLYALYVEAEGAV
nr:SMP-30/gluconolactonase/LRE family protein [Caballeronia sp. Lep1P3]